MVVYILAVTTASSLLGYDTTSLAHLYLESFSHSSLQILSSCQVGWEHHCRAISRYVRSSSSPGSGWAIQRLVSKPLLRCLGCVLRVVVLLEGEPSPQFEVLSALEQNLSFSYIFAPFIFASILTSLSVPSAEKHTHSMMLSPLCFTEGWCQVFQV